MGEQQVALCSTGSLSLQQEQESGCGAAIAATGAAPTAAASVAAWAAEDREMEKKVYLPRF